MGGRGVTSREPPTHAAPGRRGAPITHRVAPEHGRDARATDGPGPGRPATYSPRRPMSAQTNQEGRGAAAPRVGHPLVELLAIAAPTVATMASFTIMQFADKFMVSRIGPDPVYIAAQSNGALASFVPIAAVMGLLTIINTYVSQNLGAGRPERGAAYAWTG